MPGFDGTGGGFGPCGAGNRWRRRFWLRAPVTEPVTITKEEQKKILQEELKEIEAEKQEIDKQLKELK